MIDHVTTALSQDGMVALVVAVVGLLVKATETVLKRRATRRTETNDVRIENLELRAEVDRLNKHIRKLEERAVHRHHL